MVDAVRYETVPPWPTPVAGASLQLIDVAQDNIVTVAIANWRRHGEMEWILLEAGVALFLAVFIVWFTTGGKRKPPPAAAQPAPNGKGNPEQRR